MNDVNKFAKTTKWIIDNRAEIIPMNARYTRQDGSTFIAKWRIISGSIDWGAYEDLIDGIEQIRVYQDKARK